MDREPLEHFEVSVTANTEPLERSLAQAARHGQQFSRILATSFTDVAIKGRSITDVFSSVAMGLSKMALQAAFKPLEQGFGQFISGLVSGAASTAPTPLPVPFAKGGIIRSPMTFPLGGAGTGLAGERGAEAILPLARGPDGRLGVQAGGASAHNIVFQITTPDAESFRRSETQIAAMVARAAALGQRNA